MRFACVLVLGSVLIVAATAAAQEGGLTFGVVDVSEVTGGLGVRRARAAVVPHERALWRCAGAHEGSRIALVIARRVACAPRPSRRGSTCAPVRVCGA